MQDATRFFDRIRGRRYGVACALLLGCIGMLQADTIAPLRVDDPNHTGELWATYAPRTLRVALVVDRDGAQVLAFTRKDTPAVRSLRAEDPIARRAGPGPQLELEVTLTADDGRRYVRALDARALCLQHGPESEPHVAGDTIRLHREAFVVDLPDLPGLDTLEVAHYPDGRSPGSRAVLGAERLGAGLFDPAGSPAPSFDAASRASGAAPEARSPAAAGRVRWPEDFGDTQVFSVFGQAAEGAARVNVTIVPDGYAFQDKALMQQHAAALVAAFRARTPYREHDPFINYTLVYAYSDESGTDQCDCGSIVSTAMGTGFPAAGGACGASVNRCLYYGTQCDAGSAGNIALAELRAPYHDTTIVMVNTARYGGCGGSRAVYSAGNPAATEIAIHELGHSLAGLADEYGGSAGCGLGAGEINTSADGVDGAWPEWRDQLGPPVEGAQYYDHCLFRPAADCQMRALSREFCPVCRQHWAGVFMGHQRVRATAPIAGLTPGPVVNAIAGQPIELSVQTRLPGAGTVNTIEWFVATPAEAVPEAVASGTPSLVRVFDQPGSHRVTVRVIADAEVIRPERWGDNVDTATFDVFVAEAEAPGEVAAPGSATPLVFPEPDRLTFGPAQADSGVTFNVYRGDLGGMAKGALGSCVASGLAQAELPVPEAPPPGHTWFFLASASNAAGEGPLGESSAGAARTPLAPCD